MKIFEDVTLEEKPLTKTGLATPVQLLSGMEKYVEFVNV